MDENKELTKISITKPSKTTVKVGENLDIAGMKVVATYSDGTTEDVTGKCKYYWDGKLVNTLNGQELTEGKHTIKAEYNGKEDSFEITVEKVATPSGEGKGSSQVIKNLIFTAAVHYERRCFLFCRFLPTRFSLRQC